jgi:predicted dehydrogenase
VENHNYRFNEPALAMERLVRNGTLGDISEVDVRMQLAITEGGRMVDPNLPHDSHQLPCGAIHEFISHLVYLALRFMPKGTPETDRIRATWSNHSRNDLFQYDDLDAVIVRETCHAHIRFSARNAPNCFRLTVRGKRGTVSCDFFLPQLELQVPRPGGQQLTPLINLFSNGLDSIAATARNFLDKVRQKSPLEGIQVFLDRTYQAIQEGTEPPVSFDDMDSTSRMIDALLTEENRR